MGRTLAFYQKFNLEMERLSKALRCVQRKLDIGYDELGDCMGVNRPVAEGYVGWLRHTGLVQAVKERGAPLANQLTPFGTLAVQYDPGLDDIGTQWLLHYYLATEHSERSEAWFVLINDFLSAGRVFTGAQFTSYFAGAVGHTITNKGALEKDPQSALSSYTRPQALGRIGIIAKEKDNYRATSPNLPNLLVLAFVMLDWWQRRYPNVSKLRLSQFCEEEGSPGRIGLMDRSRVEQIVRELRNFGYLDFSASSHEQVTRLYTEPADHILKEYYTRL